MILGVSLATGTPSRLATAQTAQPASRPKEEERTALYREGVALAEAGRWNDALQKFEKVVAIRSAPPALIALATAQEKVGKLASAKRTYLSAHAQAAALGDTAMAERAERALAAIDGRIARIVVVVPYDASGAEVRIDGSPAAADPRGIEADPGEHEVMVNAPGRSTVRKRVTLAAEERREVAVEFGRVDAVDGAAASSTPSALPQSGDDVRGGPPMGSWILGGAGIAASVTGLVIRIEGQNRYGDVREQCPNDSCATTAEVEKGNAAREQMLVGSIVAGAGLALIAGAGVWWALTPSPSNSERAQAPAARISVAPTLLYGGAAMMMRGSF